MNEKGAKELLKEWCNSLPVHERLQEFDKLSEQDRTVMLLPENNRLEHGYYPSNWKQEMDNAVKATHQRVDELFPKPKRPPSKRRRIDFIDQSDDGDSDDYDSHDEIFGGTNIEEDDEASDHHFFVDKLRYCIPLMAGFHLDQLRGDIAWCYCPCSGKLSSWIGLCDLQSYFERFQVRCNARKKMKPHDLRCHLDTTSKGCNAHRLILYFLKTLYRNFHGIGIQHIAFENPNTRQYNIARDYM